MMNEVLYDPFLAFEQDAQYDLQAVFTEEAAVLLSRDPEGNLADDLLVKTDNLLSTAQGMLEYSEYLEVVRTVAERCNHDHGLQEMFENSEHNEALPQNKNHEHNSAEHASKNAESNKKKKKKDAILGWSSILLALLPKSKK